MLKVYKNNGFAKWQKRHKLPDKDLLAAVDEMEKGLIDANLGGSLYKKRIAKKGMGKSGAYRTIVAMKKECGWFFIFGFEKNETDNIDKSELTALKDYVDDYLFPNLAKLLMNKELIEVLL